MKRNQRSIEDKDKKRVAVKQLPFLVCEKNKLYSCG